MQGVRAPTLAKEVRSHMSHSIPTHTQKKYIYIYITKKQYYNKFHKILKKNQYGFGIRKDPRPPKIQ